MIHLECIRHCPRYGTFSYHYLDEERVLAIASTCFT